MVSAVAGAYTYTYDGDGQRVKKSSGKLYWYGSKGEVLTESDLSRKYYWTIMFSSAASG